jgi:hypothetical protein
VNGQDSKAEIFDVFLCHNGEDKPAIREIAQKLKKEGVTAIFRFKAFRFTCVANTNNRRHRQIGL